MNTWSDKLEGLYVGEMGENLEGGKASTGSGEAGANSHEGGGSSAIVGAGHSQPVA